MKVEAFIDQPGAWLSSGKGSEVVVSSRIRLARNLKDKSFPGWSEQAECVEVWGRIYPSDSGPAGSGC
ncbi:MAG: hypothetical protein AAF492_21260 [Verrucomicrobiota bacterium]